MSFSKASILAIVILSSLLLSSVAHSRGAPLPRAQGPFLDQVPDDVMSFKIIKDYLDTEELETLSLTSRSFNGIAIRLKEHPESLEILKNNLTRHQIDGLDRISNLSIEKIEGLLANEDFVMRKLLDRIHRNDLELVKALLQGKDLSEERERNRVFVAALLAKYRINISAAGDAAWRAVGYTVRDSAWHAAWDVTGPAAGNIARDSAWYAIWCSAWDAAGAATLKPTRDVLRKLGITDPAKSGNRAYEISDLLALNWVRNYNGTYFENAFNAAYHNLDGYMSIQEASRIMDEAIGDQALVNNPFIEELRSFMDQVKQLVLRPNRKPKPIENYILPTIL